MEDIRVISHSTTNNNMICSLSIKSLGNGKIAIANGYDISIIDIMHDYSTLSSSLEGRISSLSLFTNHNDNSTYLVAQTKFNQSQFVLYNVNHN